MGKMSGEPRLTTRRRACYRANEPRESIDMYQDLREFIEQVDQLGALRRIEGADANFEIGGITEVAAGRPDGPALLFAGIKGFARGFLIFSNAVTNPQRAALAPGIDPAVPPLDAPKAW